MLPRSTKAVIDLDSWSKPPIFGFLQRVGNLPDEEMLRIFNAGIGFVVVVEPAHADAVLEILAEHGERAWAIGRIEARADDEPGVVVRRS
jgi:phosphoribosylformylglycinamidine cyclo-ligase